MYSVTDRKRSPYWFKNLNPTTCCVNEITTEENDSERFKRFKRFKRKEGI